MTSSKENNSNDRLDRIEKLVESNARTIQIIVNEAREDRAAWRKDRENMYELMARLAQSQADLASTQASFYRRLEQMDRRQADITEILKLLVHQQENSTKEENDNK